MARGLDHSKRRTWSERLRRFADGDLTVASFCDTEGVSTAAFYQWRRKLKRERASRSGSDKPPRPSFLRIETASSLLSGQPVEILFPNGVRVNLTTADPQWAVAAITAAAQAPRWPRAQEEAGC